MESSKTNQLGGSGVANESQRKISAKEVVADIREGMSDLAFEQKYRLTPGGRENLFKKLTAKGLVTEAELQRRSNLLKSQEPSGNTPDSQADPIPTRIAARDADEKQQTPTTSLKSLILPNVGIAAVGAILGGISAAVVTTYWGTTKTWAKWLGKSHATTSWKWIIICAIVGAILAFCVNWILKQRRKVSPPNQPLPATHTPQSGNQVSTEEITKAISIMEKARRDMFGIAGDIGILAVGAAGGGISAVVLAAFFGATRIWGITTAAKWAGLTLHGRTPWTWIIGCAVVGAVVAFSVSRLVRSGAQGDERRKRNIDELKKDVGKRKEEAGKSTIDKDKFDNLSQSLTMLLSNGKMTPEESDGLVNGIKSGTITYEFAFATLEEYLKE